MWDLDDRIEIYFLRSNSFINVPYSSITNIENTYEKKSSIRWIIFFGIVSLPWIIIPLLWKEKHAHTKIHFNENSNDEYVIIDFDKSQKFVQNFLIKKIKAKNKDDKGKTIT